METVKLGNDAGNPAPPTFVPDAAPPDAVDDLPF